MNKVGKWHLTAMFVLYFKGCCVLNGNREGILI